MKFEWEVIYKKEQFGKWTDVTLRSKVIGGWVLRHSGVSTFDANDNIKFGYAAESSMVFIPDINHEWKIERLEEKK